MTPTLSRPSPSSMTASDRRQEAFLLIDEIKAAIAGGASFRNPEVSGFFVDMRDALAKWGPNTHVSPGQLRGLRKVRDRMKGGTK